MPDIFQSFEESLGKKKNQTSPEEQTSPQQSQHAEFMDYPTTHEEAMQQNHPQEKQKREALAGPGSLSGDPKEQERQKAEAYSNQQLGQISTKNSRNLEKDPNSWSPEYTMRSFLNESGTSIMRGVGKHIMAGTGDMFQVAGGLAGMDISKGNMISRALQEAGNDLADDYKSYIPEELMHENLTMGSMMNPKFWSTHVAEMVPQLAEFILLSKGGSALARKGASTLLKGMKGAKATTKGASGISQEVFGTGKGVAGKLATDQGLTQLGNTLSGAVGGGIAGNVFSGMLNAAQVVNENKDLKDANGNPLYTEEELSEMAAGTLRNNAAYMAVDMASWGLTYGGGWKALKGMNPLRKGKKLYSAAERAKISSNMFKYDINPVLKGIGRLAGKAGTEGFEETIQESWEEWAAKKAEYAVTGEGDSKLLSADGFYDFYTSKENEGTRVLSAAVGALGGGVFNIKTLFNQKAQEAFDMKNRLDNLSNITEKQGSEQENSWQEYHIQQQIADIVIDGKEDLYEDFSNKLVENGNITEDQKKAYDEMLLNFKEVKAKGEKLNVKGLDALMKNKQKEVFFDGEINRYVANAQEKIETYKNIIESTENPATIRDFQKQIRNTEQELDKQIRAASIKKAEAVQNQHNLMLGKKATAVDFDIQLDEFGNEMIIDGLSNEQFNELTKEGDKISKAQKATDKAAGKFKIPTMSSLNKNTREMVDKFMSPFKGMFQGETEQEEDLDENTEEQSTEEASGETEVNGQKVKTPKTEQEAETEADQMADDATISEDEVIDQETYDLFNKEAKVSQGVIDDIAKTIQENGTLSDRQDEIRAKNPDAVKRAIVKNILGTTDENAREDINESEELSDEGVEEERKNINLEARDQFAEKVKDFKKKARETGKEWRDRVGSELNKWEKFLGKKFTTEEIKQIQEGAENADFIIIDDNDLSENESEFVKAEVVNKKPRKSIKDVVKEKTQKAKESWNFNKKRSRNAETGMDKREGNNIASANIREAFMLKSFMNRLRLTKNSNKNYVSKNEMDNFLNSSLAYNEFGPTEIHKMSAVNHYLKNAFPDEVDSPRVMIVKNMFRAIGSQGLGHLMGSTIYIDEKAWNQDKIFMHEMSHVFYRLARNTPEVQELTKKALANKDLVAKIKRLYPDYTQYARINEDGTRSVFVQRDIESILDSEIEFDDFIRKGIEQKEWETIPLSKQELLVEEMFVAQLEGPLAENFDKTFTPKNEPRRQKDVKKFWGMIRKRGELIQENDNITKLLRDLDENPIPGGNLKDYMMETFRRVTKGVKMDSYGLDARVEELNEEQAKRVADVRRRKMNNASFPKEDFGTIKEDDVLNEYEDSLEDYGTPSFAQDYNDKAKGATRIIKRFGVVYNKAIRTKFIREGGLDFKDWNTQELFDRDAFESMLYSMATETNDADVFIDAIETSALSEIQSFNNYLDRVHPDTKLQLLNSMHFVFSNSKHTVGFRNTIANNGEYDFVNSLSQRELNNVDDVLGDLATDLAYNNETPKGSRFKEAFNNIKAKRETKEDIYTILEGLTGKDFNMEKVLEQGYLTYQGETMPIEIVVAGFIRKGYMDNKKYPNQPYAYNGRKLAEALVNTNRKFSPLSSVMNAENNMTPVRIVNNHLTKEIDNMIDFLSGENTPTQDEFLEKFSHLNHKNKNGQKGKYVPNQLLVGIYDDYVKTGKLPTVSQYNGIQNKETKTGNLYAGSTALEQSIEDLLIFNSTSRRPNGQKKSSYLFNVGAFSDSPRKFFLSSKRIDFNDAFRWVKKDGKDIIQFNVKGITNSAFDLHNQITKDDDPANGNKRKFLEAIKNSIATEMKFIRRNSEQISRIDKMKPYFDKNGRLNKEGQEMVSEYVLNNIVHNYNISDTFLPGVNRNSTVKRFKMNSSPVFSVKNPNFKIEPLFFSDEIVGNSIAGTDSGMYILEEDAKNLQNVGRGVFDMNNGFKLLNASIEKENENFAGKAAYLKGYTTIIKKGHPLYEAMRLRKDRYNEWHKEKYGEMPDGNLSGSNPNHMVIAIPESSDKTKFNNRKFINEVDGNLEYTEEGLQMTPSAIAQNPEVVNDFQEKNFYKNGNFVGIQAYNFGPQQLMDKRTSEANTPVQMVNSIIVNATLNGELEIAESIQEDISNQKKKNLQEVLDRIKSADAEAYKELIMDGLNLEDMDQAQRMMLSDNGSIFHPYMNEIAVNQLAKTLRRKGNKLATPGTLAHQKPDIGFQTSGNTSSRLKTYQENGDGTLSPAEMIMPKHMQDASNPVRARQAITRYNMAGQAAIGRSMEGLSKKEKESQSRTDDLNAMQFAALEIARKRHNVKGNEAFKYIGKELDKNGVHIGFHVKGDTVIASRVPGHGPSSTGVFEIVGFDNTEGNQVMVPTEFNEIIGSDNDGDALFIQTKGGKDFAQWNSAFDKMTKYWLSPKMKDQIRSQMVFEEETKKVVEKVNGKFKKEKDYTLPGSPEQRRIDYNNTMVSKRNVGPVFNIHKIANLLATYEIEINNPIKIGGVTYDKFQDTVSGEQSRNQKSAILANLILDNSKWSFADDLGINEHNISQAVLLTNMGVSLEDLGMILNSPAAKLWSEKNRSNNSMFHEGKTQNTIVEEIYKELKLGKRKKGKLLAIDPKNTDKMSQQAAIIETLSYLSEMNSEVQNVSKIMTGHKAIHVNPLVLQNQLEKFRDTVNNTEGTLMFNDAFKSNPDLKHYEFVAESTLEHTKNMNPVYRKSTNKVISAINRKIGQDLTDKQIEELSKDITKFNTSRLLGLNNVSKDYAKQLMDPESDNSIYRKLDKYLEPLKEIKMMDDNDITNSVSKLENSILFRKALNFNLKGNNQYISANTSFVNESFNEIERERVRSEFEKLPTDLRDDLILFDLIKHGWKGRQSMVPFFAKDAGSEINFRANVDLNEKNRDISPKVLRKLEETIALKHAQQRSNPFKKVYVKNASDVNATINEMFKDPQIVSKAEKGQGGYIVARSKVNGKMVSELYEIPTLDANDAAAIKTERTKTLMRERAVFIAKERTVLIPNTLSKDPNIDLSLISDDNVQPPFKSSVIRESLNDMGSLVQASITYEEAMRNINNKMPEKNTGMDAREDWDINLFSKKEKLTRAQYDQAMEYNQFVSENLKDANYKEYEKAKIKANKEYEAISGDLDSKSKKELLEMYQKYGSEDAYAYSIVMRPIVLKLADQLASDQLELLKKNKVDGKAIGFDGNDVSKIRSYMMSGSTIPSNHPGAQSMARMMEIEYKNFMQEKRKYMKQMDAVTRELYKEKLGYGKNRYMNALRRLGDFVFQRGGNVYERLYGNMVIRNEVLDEKGNLTYDYKLRPAKDVQADFENGVITKAEKDFYDFFRKTTNELMPPKVAAKRKEDYIPHTAMNKLEALSSRGLLGLMAHSRNEEEAIYDVKLYFKDPENKEQKLMNFKQVEDLFKRDSADRFKKNDISKIVEYQQAKRKAKKLLKTGKNEDGSKIIYGGVSSETVLGFGALNRFTNNRSVKATELPSMDLNKALGDYIHSTLFVNGNKNFKGMEKLQGYIDGVLAFNRENNLPNMNNHIQTVWKDYFTRGKRQESFMGKKADRIIRGLTRLNLFYALGYQANKNTGGLYSLGNVLVGKYHNIKELGGKQWLRGEAKFWGVDSMEGGIQGVIKRHKRMAGIMKNLNFMEINVYDEVNIERKDGLDKIMTDIALMPMVVSEKWVQQVHMIGHLTDEELSRFDEVGNYKPGEIEIDKNRLVELEDKVKASHGRGYQPTDQRALQMYSWGNMMLQFSKFIPTMVQDRFAKKDVNIYGRENIGSLRAVGEMLRHVINNPKDFKRYRASLSEDERKRFDQGIKGMGMAAVISMVGVGLNNETLNQLYWDANYYMNYGKMTSKGVPPAIQSADNLTNQLF